VDLQRIFRGLQKIFAEKLNEKLFFFILKQNPHSSLLCNIQLQFDLFLFHFVRQNCSTSGSKIIPQQGILQALSFKHLYFLNVIPVLPTESNFNEQLKVCLCSVEWTSLI